MKKIFTAVALVLCIPSSYAAQNSQQTKMGTCNAEAKTKELKGDERKKFMSTCLSADKPNSQQDKMKKCSAANKGKKGDEYKAAQKACLST
jgi:hypothetical protein